MRKEVTLTTKEKRISYNMQHSDLTASILATETQGGSNELQNSQPRSSDDPVNYPNIQVLREQNTLPIKPPEVSFGGLEKEDAKKQGERRSITFKDD